MNDNPKRYRVAPSDDSYSEKSKNSLTKTNKKQKSQIKEVPSFAKARKLFNSAKQNWLYPKQESDHNDVEKLLRECIEVLEDDGIDISDEEVDREDIMFLRAQTHDALTLFAIQKSNSEPKDVYRLLREGGYVARLSKDILHYTIPTDVSASAVEQHECQSPPTEPRAPCRVYDDALPPEQLDILIRALCPKNASYWKDHSYSVYPPTPYFSYVFDLKDTTLNQLGALGDHVRTIKQLSCELISDITEETPQYAEVWAHHRPHCSGHQLHFDSDNEGRGEVKHPLVSSIIYLSEEGCGGPSLITDQKLGDTKLAQKGWLTHPKRNRLVIFDGKVLHGVIPGRGYVHERNRVTLMVALWRDIRFREGQEPGAARPLPVVKTETKPPAWYASLTLVPKNIKLSEEHKSKAVKPERVECVFSTSKEKKIKKGIMPHYDTVFQGF